MDGRYRPAGSWSVCERRPRSLRARPGRARSRSLSGPRNIACSRASEWKKPSTSWALPFTGTGVVYRKHKVNPMGGCLPMVAQVPIFYALYLALSVSVELQNAAFLCFGRLFGVDLWICDLAAHDPTYVLPVLMGITMFIQQKLTP